MSQANNVYVSLPVFRSFLNPCKTSAACETPPKSNSENIPQAKCAQEAWVPEIQSWLRELQLTALMLFDSFCLAPFERCKADTLISFLVTCQNLSVLKSTPPPPLPHEVSIYALHVWNETRQICKYRLLQTNQRKTVRDFPNVCIIC